MVYTPAPPYTQIFFLWALKNFSYRQELEKFRISWGPSLLGGPNFLFGREGARPFPSINNESCKLKNRWWQNYLFYVCMLTVLTFLGKVSVSKFSKCPFKLSETRLLMFGNNSMKVWIPFDELWICQYYLVVTLWIYQYCVIETLKKFLL